MRAKFSAIVAINRKNIISIDGKIPWHNRHDLRNFRKLTWGHIVLMGRNTFNSIGKPLKGRFNVVLTARPLMVKPNVAAVDHSFITSLSNSYDGEVFVIGGAEVYRQMAPMINKIYITVINDNSDGKNALYFPWSEFHDVSWDCTKHEKWDNATYIILER